MAKALFGHLSPRPDVGLLDEVGRLRRRVEDLERELSEARAERQQLQAQLQLAPVRMADLQMADDDLIRLSHLEHAGL